MPEGLIVDPTLRKLSETDVLVVAVHSSGQVVPVRHQMDAVAADWQLVNVDLRWDWTENKPDFKMRPDTTQRRAAGMDDQPAWWSARHAFQVEQTLREHLGAYVTSRPEGKAAEIVGYNTILTADRRMRWAVITWDGDPICVL